ncbi:MAG: WecB/TagA/CpsF family glycosyltransferase [Candidatus Kerfeldbacteria bacterium]|nr:WecB/TagA/CpsF family glycosyltransferase [Candidatus Kerfeldbacteria bacterium]
MRVTMLGVELDPITTHNALQTMHGWLQEGITALPRVVLTPNPEMLVYAQRHPEFKTILNSGDLNLPDGIGLKLCSGGALPERVTGTDIVQQLVPTTTHIGCVITATGLSTRADVLRVLPQAEVITEAEQFSQPHALVLVGLGSPDQEHWIQKHRATLPGCRVVMAVGGSIDHLTGKQVRAPLLFRRLGLEWLWRLVLQPQRWRRILTATVVFPWLLLTQNRFHD